MPRLSPEERAQFEAFQLRDQEPEDEGGDDFDVVIEDSASGRRVTLPYSKSKAMLKRMGFDLDELEPPEGGDPDPDADPDADPLANPEDELGTPATRGGKKGYWKPKP